MDFELARVDEGRDLLGALVVDGAPEGDRGSNDLLDGALEVDGHALGAQLLGDVDHVRELDVSVVLHVLLLLSVARALLERLDDQGRRSGKHRDEALPVLDHHFDLDLDSAPVGSRLLDVFTHLLGGHTQRSALGGKSGGAGHFTTDDLQVDYGHQGTRTYRTSSLQRWEREASLILAIY